MRFLTALVAGLLFGAGLLVSGMANPANVLGFLDITGDWNPALAFTMAGAIAAAAPAFYIVRRRQRAAAEGSADPPRRIDGMLVGGAATFGIGWGLSGICPGPGLVLLTSRTQAAVLFVAAMLVGMLVARSVEAVRKSSSDG